MTYLPHTDDDRRAMLQTVGVDDLADLFADVPASVRFPALDLPAPLSEMEAGVAARDLAARNAAIDPRRCFLGAGAWYHYRPATVDHVLSRAEFFTAYTPYQPELSQGMLQAMFEFQTMICRLTGMDVSNASHYDGATSLAEAVLLSLHVAKGARNKVVVSSAVNPQYRAVLQTYLRGTGASVVGDDERGTDPGRLAELMDGDTASLVVQDPDFFGQFLAVDRLADAVHAAGALLIVVADPIALGLFRPPGDYGADIVVADGQPLGLPPSFGGPHLGIFATRQAHARRMVGRLVGETTDAEGRRGYVLTLGTREQHIRRERATSNICTNAALTALGAAVYLATMGKLGLRHIAELCHAKSHYAASAIAVLPGVEVNPQAPDAPFFRDFVVRLPRPVAEVNQVLRDRFDVVGGYDLGADYPDLENHMLVAVTEMIPRAEIDRLVGGIAHACA
jgi:glycine dehydrogenase subunit 1